MTKTTAYEHIVIDESGGVVIEGTNMKARRTRARVMPSRTSWWIKPDKPVLTSSFRASCRAKILLDY
jgi:hypothetical protein